MEPFKPSSPFVIFLYYSEEDELVIDRLEVEKEFRGLGLARKTMNEFIEWVHVNSEEIEETKITLYPYAQDDSTCVDKLKEFYLEWFDFCEAGMERSI